MGNELHKAIRRLDVKEVERLCETNPKLVLEKEIASDGWRTALQLAYHLDNKDSEYQRNHAFDGGYDALRNSVEIFSPMINAIKKAEDFLKEAEKKLKPRTNDSRNIF